MKFTTVFFSAILALGVCAQNSTATPPASTTVALTPAQSSEIACLAQCAPADLDCKNKCIAASSTTNVIAQCQMNCNQGNGTAAENASYQTCIRNCIDTNGGSAASTTGAATGAAGTGAATGGATGAETGVGTGTPTATGGSTGTGTSSSSTASKSSAADSVRMGASVFGLVGMVAAMIAL